MNIGNIDQQETELEKVIEDTELDVEDTTCRMVKYLDLSSEESEEEHYNTLKTNRQLEHQFSVQPANLNANHTTDLTELFDLTFQKGTIKKEQKQIPKKPLNPLCSEIVNINKLLKRHNFTPITAPQDSLSKLFEVLTKFDALKSKKYLSNSQQTAFILEQENAEIIPNSTCVLHSSPKPIIPSEVKDQLISLSEKILKKDSLLRDLKKKYKMIKVKVEEVHDLKRENKKCVGYIREIEKDKDELLSYAQMLESRVEWFKKACDRSNVGLEDMRCQNQFGYQRKSLDCQTSNEYTLSREDFSYVSNKRKTPGYYR
ncbi:unnamed protein product [Moneuplotes crassus]|uniref:Uncharacterized protein n=1 Tax=Euplotes crassus TaxID=5936 RepID=A0AAD2CZS6_EUPCR|nr:unnamed protein product [Moneuplotes crassus]